MQMGVIYGESPAMSTAARAFRPPEMRSKSLIFPKISWGRREVATPAQLQVHPRTFGGLRGANPPSPGELRQSSTAAPHRQVNGRNCHPPTARHDWRRPACTSKPTRRLCADMVGPLNPPPGSRKPGAAALRSGNPASRTNRRINGRFRHFDRTRCDR